MYVCMYVYMYVCMYVCIANALINKLLPFPVLHGAFNIMSYCDIRYHGSTWVTFLSNNGTICHTNNTIWCHNNSTMTRVSIGKYWLVNMVFWVSMHNYER